MYTNRGILFKYFKLIDPVSYTCKICEKYKYYENLTGNFTLSNTGMVVLKSTGIIATH